MNCFLYHSDLKWRECCLRDQKTYLDIAEKTGASTATISRVNRSLNLEMTDMRWYSAVIYETSGTGIEKGTDASASVPENTIIRLD